MMSTFTSFILFSTAIQTSFVLCIIPKERISPTLTATNNEPTHFGEAITKINNNVSTIGIIKKDSIYLLSGM